MKSFRGMGVALITPFKDDLSVDVEGLKRLVAFNINEGADYLVVMGTTGESATLTKEEKELVKETVIKANANKLPLVIGIGGNNTAAIKQEVSSAEALQGFDAILSVSPYYNRPTQKGIFEHYKTLAEVAVKPIILYNVPARTGSNITPETTLKLAKECNNIIGIKEAAGSMDQALSILKDRPDGFLVLSGDDMLALPMICAGGDGVISVIGQGLVSLFSRMTKDGLEGAFAKAYQTHYKLMPIIDLIFKEGNPAGIKSLLSHKGICKRKVRLPLLASSVELDQKIKEILNTLD